MISYYYIFMRVLSTDDVYHNFMFSAVVCMVINSVHIQEEGKLILLNDFSVMRL